MLKAEALPITTQPTPTGALICALMAPSPDLLQQATDLLATHFGPPRKTSRIYPFDYTEYYADEMGDNLVKNLAWFGEPVELSFLPEAKTQAMVVEHRFARPTASGLSRRVNADPGLVTVDSLVLASTKYSGHRICIGPGIFAETTLLFAKGRYAPMPWTYLDYQNEPVQEFLMAVRRGLLAKS